MHRGLDVIVERPRDTLARPWQGYATNMQRSILLSFIICSQACAAQDNPAAQKRLVPQCVGFYNVENLFDTIDSPDTDDAEFLPDGPKQWTSSRYQRKLHNMARVIAELGTDIHPDGVAVLGLGEVETGGAVEDLVRTPPIDKRGYRVVSHEGPDARGVDVALIYDPKRFTFLRQKAYRLRIDDQPDFRTRDQLVVSGLLEGDTLHVIVNHWPSRRGGEKRSRPLRCAAADLSRHIIDSLLARNANARIIHMGDLNDDPVDISMRKHLRVVGEKQFATGGMLYDPMVELYQKGIGSLAWSDSWNLFDQISLSPALVTGAGGRYKYHSTRIYNEPYLRQKDGNFKGYPFRSFVGHEWKDGYSDHFPVYVVLVREL